MSTNDVQPLLPSFASERECENLTPSLLRTEPFGVLKSDETAPHLRRPMWHYLHVIGLTFSLVLLRSSLRTRRPDSMLIPEPAKFVH